MSENKHTAEPWAVKGAAIRTADEIGIDVIARMQVSNQPFWDEDARRIVACVNACAGIPTELLNDSKCWAEAGIETATSLRKQIATLTRQRDLAVEAITRSIDMVGHPDNITYLQQTLDAIKESEGK